MIQPQDERMAIVELRLKNLEETVSGMDKKLDDLLALRNKGAGILWLMSGLVGIVLILVTWFKH